MHMLLLVAAIASFSSALAQELPPPEGELPLPPVPEGYVPVAEEVGSRPAMARPLGPEDLQHASGLESGLLIVVVDPEDTLAGAAPTGRFGRGESWTALEFRDDGQSPDGVSGDRQYVAWSPLVEQGGMTALQIFGADEALLYSDKRIPLPWDRELPVVSLLLLSGGGHIATVDTNDLDSDGDVDAAEDSSRRSGGITDAVECPEVVEDSSPSSLQWLLMALGGGLVLASVWILRRHRDLGSSLGPAGEPASPAQPALDASRTWLLPDGTARIDCMVALARLRTPGGRVLISPRAQSREALREALRGLGNVSWPMQPEPAVGPLIELSRSLEDWGRGLVIVEGPGALQRAGEEEDPGAVIKELIQTWSGDLDLLVLLVPGEQAEDMGLRPLSPEDLHELGLSGVEPGDA